MAPQMKDVFQLCFRVMVNDFGHTVHRHLDSRASEACSEKIIKHKRNL